MPSPLAATPPTLTIGQTLPRTHRCDATVGQAPGAFGFSPVTCRQAVGVRTFVTTTGLRVGFCPIDGHEGSVRRRFVERLEMAPVRRHRVDGCAMCRIDGSFGPSHDASPRCESGKREHCTCSACFD